MADIWKSIKGLVTKVAPILGNAILPGVGGIAGSIVAEVLGADPEDPAEIEMKLANATPEQIKELKQAAMQHKERLTELAIEQEKTYLADRQDARQRELELTKTTGKRDTNLYILAWTVVVSFFLTVGILIFADIPEGQNEILYMLLGVLGTGFITVIQYFFGSSKSSTDKTQLLAVKQ